MYLEEDGLQLPAVFPTVLLREDYSVHWDAVVGHPALTLQHPYHNVWKTVLRLETENKCTRFCLCLLVKKSFTSYINTVSSLIHVTNSGT